MKPPAFTRAEKRALDRLLKAVVPRSYNSFPRRYDRAVTVLDSLRARHPDQVKITGADYLRFLLSADGFTSPDLIQTALAEARTIASQAAAEKGIAKRWPKKS